MMYFIAFSFGYTSYQSRPRGSQAVSFVIEGHRRKIPKNSYLCMLIISEVYSIVTYSLSEN